MGPTSTDIRRAFTDFWVERGHRPMPAADLVPQDPTIMFTIAGMVPFKDFFTGRAVPEVRRATTIQPCVRTVDIDVIGTTRRHLTFFEMLGHFSFGDYFKTEAIPWCWELYTEVFKMDPEKLWVTVHETDDEAEKIWTDSVGVPAGRIQRMGEDNFWKMGPTGPCGPCSELYYDLGESFGEGGGPAFGGEERYLEVGNLVFMQYDRKKPEGALEPLPAPSVDFGGGLERVLAVVQAVGSVFLTDVIEPCLRRAEELTGARAKGGDPVATARLCVMADHARTMSFVASEGVVPSNDGRGFVLRRLVRRVVMKASQLGCEEPVVGPLVQAVAATMGTAYPRLIEALESTRAVLEHEEEAFRRTLRAGLAILEESLGESSGGVLDGRVAFQLHDTHGFPIDLTREIAEERGVAVDMAGFEAEMERQRSRARRATKERAPSASEDSYMEILNRSGTTEFVGYDSLVAESEVVAVAQPASRPERSGSGEPLYEGPLLEVFLRTSPFYAESGGQLGDTGLLVTSSGRARVVDTTFALPGLIRHLCVLEDGDIVVGDLATASVDAERRDGLRRNHTGTHLIHWALREVLGDHVHQQGSLVAADRLRFDFSHFRQADADELRQVEDLVNSSVLTDSPVATLETSREEAMAMGAMAIFGEKYGERVRVVEAGPSRELCGGTHVHALGMIGPVRIVAESSVGSGIRRIEAVSGSVSIAYMRSLEDKLSRAARALRVTPAEVPEALERTLERLRQIDEELKKESARRRAAFASSLAEKAESGVVVERHDGASPEELRELAAQVRSVPGVSAVVLIGSPDGQRVALVAAVPKGSPLMASDLIAEAAKAVGGGSGRAQDLAVAGGRDPSRIDEALRLARRRAEEAVSR
jgi:alanyl-tRNA synthetase